MDDKTWVALDAAKYHRIEKGYDYCATCSGSWPCTVRVLADGLESLQTWEGLMRLLDTHWPPDIFPTAVDDPARESGPRIVSMMRAMDAVKTDRDEFAANIDAALAYVEANKTGDGWDDDMVHGADVATLLERGEQKHV